MIPSMGRLYLERQTVTDVHYKCRGTKSLEQRDEYFIPLVD